MTNNSLVTSGTHSSVDVTTGRQKKYWIEIQLVDEQGDPVANMPWSAESHHPVSGRADKFTYGGQSDADGHIRIDMPHGLELLFTVETMPLLQEMEKRRLRVGRNALQDSTVRPEAEANGLVWHYAVVGELCQSSPNLELRPGETLPLFHFPARSAFKGFKFRTNELEKRHVIEICPFRAWELVLHHQHDYSIANAINLAVAASLAYADNDVSDAKSIVRFFINQCQDLSCLPQLHKDDNLYNALVQDVPFSERYYPPVFMDTSEDTSGSAASNTELSYDPTIKEEGVGKADGDTQFFYVYNTDKVIISWRGTASLSDILTDLAFQPIKTQSCNANKTKCTTLLPVGKVHNGFWKGYYITKRKFSVIYDELISLIRIRKLFICGHSLGGALALIHAAALKAEKPLLYTYGMPRTFTYDAVAQLSDIPHFRHINDNDPIPAVPPEANLDNLFYELWGPVGATLGGLWSSLISLPVSTLVDWGDCFWHHGSPVVFLTATQSREWKECKRMLPSPAGCIILRKQLPVKAKLYLVPALAEQEMQNAGQKQKEFQASLTQADLHDYFPQGSNPERGINIKFLDHIMTSYMPYINNKLLELVDNVGIVEKRTFTEHLYQVDLFREQMKKNKDKIPEKEFARNEIFLNVEGLLQESLSSTLSMPYGDDTLKRFYYSSEELMENV